MSKYADTLSGLFRANSDPSQARMMESYMREKFPFLGIKTPERRKLLSEFIEVNGLPGYGNLKEAALYLFDQPERELHYAAIEICGRVKESWQENTILLFGKMAITKSWWDSVDSINIFCIRPYFAAHPAGIHPVTQSWIDSGNIWLQRLSLICQLRLKDKTDRKLLSRNIKRLKNSDEFFVQKAIGWALRDLAHTEPKWVENFVAKNKLKALSRREALKNLK